MQLQGDKQQIEPASDRKTVQIFFTVKEAACILKVSEDTVRRMLRRKQLKCIAISERTRRISLEALKDLEQKGA